jgi:hypothetical protein
MGLQSEDYGGRSGNFRFKPAEPPVVQVVDYLTPG